MTMIILAVLSLFILTGCGLGHALQEAGNGKEKYRACILQQLENYSAIYSVSEQTTDKATAFVVSACSQQEESHIVAMTDLAMTMTGNMVSREKFLEDEEASLRKDLRGFAANLVEQAL